MKILNILKSLDEKECNNKNIKENKIKKFIQNIKKWDEILINNFNYYLN